MAAINYRPSERMHAALRAESAETGMSIQAIIDQALTAWMPRLERPSPAEIARDFKQRHQDTYEALATR